MPKKVLICPMDWGLGHATRCVPVIREFIQRDVAVMIAGSGGALTLLKREFPGLIFFEMESYRARYSKRLFFINLLLQLPQFLKAIRKEHEQVEEIIRNHKIDLVISDNRYGCWTKLVPAVFITHQVNIILPPWIRWLQPIVNFFNHRQIRKFDRCWVPDFLDDRITGSLSCPGRMKVSFVGMLSRLRKPDTELPKRFKVLALLSGPEPQRTMLEELLRPQLKSLSEKCLLVRGLPQSETAPVFSGSLSEIDHFGSEDLQRAIEEAEWIIARSGYSTIMDLMTVGAKAIFVPTPGQTEQEYLADELKKRGVANFYKQDNFDLMKALSDSKNNSGFDAQNSNSNLLTNAIDELLKSQVL